LEDIIEADRWAREFVLKVSQTVAV
jgi:hypothetical protein